MLDRLPEPSCTSCKPTLALMTIEPDAQKLFERDSLAGAFDIKPLPPPQSGLKGHDQTEFNSWPIKERIDDTMTMLRDLTVLSLHADGFIVTGSSNVGVMAMMLGGPTGNVHSLDWRFQATSRVSPYIQCFPVGAELNVMHD